MHLWVHTLVKKYKNFFVETFFWLHVSIILFLIVSVFILSPIIVIFLVALHRVHLLIFGSCVLSILQRHFDTIPQDKNFFQFVVWRIFKKEISHKQADFIDYSIMFFVIGIAILRYVVDLV